MGITGILKEGDCVIRALESICGVKATAEERRIRLDQVLKKRGYSDREKGQAETPEGALLFMEAGIR